MFGRTFTETFTMATAGNWFKQAEIWAYDLTGFAPALVTNIPRTSALPVIVRVLNNEPTILPSELRMSTTNLLGTSLL